MTSYAIMRVGTKIKTLAQVKSLAQHLERKRPTRNADSERTHLNEPLAGTRDWCADVEARLDVLPKVRVDGELRPKIRKNAVLAIEHVLTASPEFFSAGSAEEQECRRVAWRDASMGWLRQTYGPDNVVGAILHMDETTPHIQALVVPIDDRGKLNSRHFVGGERSKLSDLQTSYFEAVAHLGLERGIEGSVATHQVVKRFYTQVQELGQRDVAQDIAAAVEIENPGPVVARPKEYVQRQRERVVASVTDRIETLMRLNDFLERKVEQQRRQIEAQAKRAQQQRLQLAELREVDLRTVMTELGGTPEGRDPKRWRLGDQVISLDGAKFYDHTLQRGGGGAIDLVMHAQRIEFRQSVAWLRDHIGPEDAVAAAAQHGREIIEQEARVPFRAPEPESTRWPQVKRWLIEERALPAGWIERLHDEGRVYADSRNNAVFVRTNANGDPVGADLRGTWTIPFAGVAAGTHKHEGWFRVTLGGAQSPEQAQPMLILAKDPLDALSVLEFHRRSREGRECGPVTVMAIDSVGTCPHQAIEETLQRGGAVRVAMDNSKTGDRMWSELQERYAHPNVVRDRPALRDWNEALQWDAICTRDAKRVDRELARKWEENGPPMASPVPTPRPPGREQDRGPDRGSYER